MARKTKEDAEKTRALILDSAEILFQENGVARTSLQNIAAHAGITRGAIYWHFKDKADVFNALMERSIWPMEHACTGCIDSAMVAADPNPVATLRHYQMEEIKGLATNKEMQRFIEIALYRVELTEDMQSVREKIIESLKNLYERNRLVFADPRVASRLKPGTTPDVAARVMQGALVGLIHIWSISPGHFDLVGTACQSMDSIFAGLGLSQNLEGQSA